MSDPMKMKNDSTENIKFLSNAPLWILISILTIVTLLVGYAIVSKGWKNKNNNSDKVSIIKTDPSRQIEAMVEDPLVIPKSKPKKVVLPEPPKLETPKKEVDILEQERQRLAALRLKRLEEAMMSPTNINVKTKKNTTNNKKTPSRDLSWLKRNMQIPKDIALGEKNEKWIAQSKESFNYLPYLKTKPLSHFELKTGTLIPSVMISGINSELPGSILGQVRENVYDTATGNYLLIPQGTKIVGKYNSDVSYGQSRLLVVWQRLVFPDGKTLNIENMGGMDQSGYAGFNDKVNNHYFRVFGSALLISIITGELSFSNGYITVNGDKATPLIGDTAVSKVGEKLIEKNLAIAPTLEIRPGYKFNIFVQKDMILEPLSASN